MFVDSREGEEASGMVPPTTDYRKSVEAHAMLVESIRQPPVQ